MEDAIQIETNASNTISFIYEKTIYIFNSCFSKNGGILIKEDPSLSVVLYPVFYLVFRFHTILRADILISLKLSMQSAERDIHIHILTDKS